MSKQELAAPSLLGLGSYNSDSEDSEAAGRSQSLSRRSGHLLCFVHGVQCWVLRLEHRRLSTLNLDIAQEVYQRCLKLTAVPDVEQAKVTLLPKGENLLIGPQTRIATFSAQVQRGVPWSEG